MSGGGRTKELGPRRFRGPFVTAALLVTATTALAERPFDFKRDTFAFANETVFEYHDGAASLRHDAPGALKKKRFMQHCFFMAGSVEKVRKFARLDRSKPSLDDAELA